MAKLEASLRNGRAPSKRRYERYKAAASNNATCLMKNERDQRAPTSTREGVEVRSRTNSSHAVARTGRRT